MKQKLLLILALLLAVLTGSFSAKADDAAEQYDSAVEEVRAGLSGMNPAYARSSLEEAQQAAKTAAQKAELSRLDECIGLIETYLTTMSKWSASNTINEIKLSDTNFASVVEMTADHITVRAEGQNKRYGINELSPKFVRILVGKFYNATPDNKAIYGAFEAFHPKGDREQARKMWASVPSCKSLIPELNIPRVLPVKSNGLDTRLAIPDSEQQKQGKEFIQKKFAPQIAKSTNEVQKAKLAALLTKSAGDKRFDAGQRFACVEMAIEMAQQSNQIEVLYDALEMKERVFQASTFRKRFKLIQNTKLDSLDKAGNKAMAVTAGKLLKECGDTDRFDDAQILIPIAKQTAAAGGVPVVARYAEQAEKFLSQRK